MAFLDNLRNRFAPRTGLGGFPQLPNMQVMPQTTQPFQMPQGIAGLQLPTPADTTQEVPPTLNARGEPLSARQMEEHIRSSKQMANARGTRDPFPLPAEEYIRANQNFTQAPAVETPSPLAPQLAPASPLAPQLAPPPPTVFNENIFDVGQNTIGQQPFVAPPPVATPPVAAPATPFGSFEATMPTLPTNQPQQAFVGATPQPSTGGGLFGNLGTSGKSIMDSPPRQIATPIPNANPVAPPAPVETVGAGFDPTQGGELRTADFQDYNNNGTDDRDEVALPPAVTPDPLTNAIAQPTPYTGAGYDAFGEQPFVSGVQRNETGLDATTKQLLFGLDGQGGFIPGAMQAAENTFFNADGTPRVVDQEVAGFTGDQTTGMGLARANVGSQNRFLEGAEGAFGQGVSDIGQGIERGRGFQQQGLGAIQSGIGGLKGELGGVEGIARGAAGEFGQQVGGIADRGINATERFGGRIGESENLMRGTTGAYDQSMTDQYYNPYEDRVVQQTIDDVLESGDKQDMAARARDIQTGGESAFGSRARLGASERREALGRGLGEALGGIRSRGFSEAQQTGMGEFARQRQAERAASQGLAGLSGARLGAQQNLGSQLTGLAGAQLGAQQNLGSSLTGLAGTRFGADQVGAGALSNMGGLESQYGQNLANAQFGLGSNLQGLGSQTQQAGAFDASQLMGQGGLQQQQAQAVLDAQRANALTAQAAPLAQYQALSPFINMAPKGSFQTSTRFTPRPSAMMQGINTGLGAFGAFGSMARGTRAT